MRMERESLKKRRCTLQRSLCTARADGTDAHRISVGGALPNVEGVGQWVSRPSKPRPFAESAAGASAEDRDPCGQSRRTRQTYSWSGFSGSKPLVGLRRCAEDPAYPSQPGAAVQATAEVQGHHRLPLPPDDGRKPIVEAL